MDAAARAPILRAMPSSALARLALVLAAPLACAQGSASNEVEASAIQAAHASSTARPATTSDLGRLFAAAQADEEALVPLLRAASAQLARLDGPAAVKLADTLEPFCERVFFGPERAANMAELGIAIHRVAKGETGSKIASRARTGAKMLAFLNEGYDERRLRVGQELKVLDLAGATLVIEVDTARYRTLAWITTSRGERVLALCAPVGLGAASSPTPRGRTTITKRVLEPQWTHPDTREVIPAGDPRNILGGYWIALDGSTLGKNGIGFHGYTGAPPADWIQQPASHGCVRMLQHDVDRLYHLAIEGTAVVLH